MNKIYEKNVKKFIKREEEFKRERERERERETEARYQDGNLFIVENSL